MEEGQAPCRRGPGHGSRRLGIDGMGEVRLGLGPVDGGMGGGIDDDGRVGRGDGRGTGGGVGQISLCPAKGGDFAAVRRSPARKLARHLPGGPEDEDLHQPFAAFSPSRSCVWPRAWIACHQGALSRYQRTVRRSPSSRVTEGAQPRSARIFEASIA